MEAIKKKYPIRDENNQPCTYPTFASQVFFDDGSVLEGKEFGSGGSFNPLTVYPVGSIYMSTNETSPAALFGGTWERINGRMLIGTGAPETNDDGTYPGSYNYAPGNKGGYSTHTQAYDEIASHYHNVAWSETGEPITGGNDKFNLNEPVVTKLTQSSEYGAYYHTATQVTGQNKPMNIMNPYFAVYMWKRVS